MFGIFKNKNNLQKEIGLLNKKIKTAVEKKEELLKSVTNVTRINVGLEKALQTQIQKTWRLEKIINKIADIAVKKEVIQDTQLMSLFETNLSRSNQNCRGSCTIFNPDTYVEEFKSFSTRKEAEDLLKDFKSGKLVLVG